MKRAPLVLAAAFLILSVSARADDRACAGQSDQGERLLEEGLADEAEAALLAAVKSCRGSKVRGARPWIALSSVYFQKQDFPKTAEFAAEALTKEADLGLAYMNLCAAEMQQKHFDAAIAACEKGIKSKKTRKDWLAKTHFNLGMAKFKKAAETSDLSDTSSEKNFLDAVKLEPAIVEAYYYAGMVNELQKDDARAAKGFYDTGCKRGERKCCAKAKEIAKAAAAAPAVKAAAPASASADPRSEDALFAELEKKYVAKGVEPAEAKKTVAEMRRNFSGMDAATRKTSVANMIKGM